MLILMPYDGAIWGNFCPANQIFRLEFRQSLFIPYLLAGDRVKNMAFAGPRSLYQLIEQNRKQNEQNTLGRR